MKRRMITRRMTRLPVTTKDGSGLLDKDLKEEEETDTVSMETAITVVTDATLEDTTEVDTGADTTATAEEGTTATEVAGTTATEVEVTTATEVAGTTATEVEVTMEEVAEIMARMAEGLESFN